MLEKVISGGQTGADRAGLEAAKACGIPTGGTAPKGYRTENGPDVSLKDFGLVESPYTSYTPRTVQNVINSDGTVLFGDMTSPGSLSTIAICTRRGKPHLYNPTPQELVDWMNQNSITILNVAGNRGSKLGSLEHTKVVNSLIATFKLLGFKLQ